MAMNKPVKVSVIIPVYNAAKYLNQSLYSVKNQMLRDIEIICVDDGSQDNSRAIMQAFSSEDNRFVLICNDVNKGTGLCRKEAILRSTGEYIMFLDADDILKPNACKELYSLIRKKQTDMLHFGTNVVPHGNISKEELRIVHNLLASKAVDRILVNDEDSGLVNQCFAENLFGFTLWNKIYKGDIVREAAAFYQDERFDIGEDLYLFFLIASLSKTYTAISTKYHEYNFGQGVTGGKAVTQRIFNARARIGRIIQYVKEFMLKRDPLSTSECALNKLNQSYVEGIVYAFVHDGSLLNKQESMEMMFDYFDPADIISELMVSYHNGNDAYKKEMLLACKGIKALTSTRRKVKTIATYYYRITNGGLERVMALLLKLWCNMGYRVILFTDEPASPQDYEYPDQVIRVVMPTIKQRDKQNYHTRVEYWRQMVRLYSVDFMVYQAWVSEEIEADIFALKSAGVTLAVYTHGMFAHGVNCGAAKYAYSTVSIMRVYQLVDAVIALTETDCAWWRMFHPHVYKTINPSTFDLSKVEQAPLNNNSILCVGRIQREKKIEDSIQILKLVLDEGCFTELHIVGKCEDEPYMEFLLALIRQLGVEKNVKLHGYQMDVKPYYKNASVYLMTSSYEGTPMTLVESMSLGVPAVVYDLPNVDLVQRREGVKVVPQKDIAGAAREIIALLNSEDYRRTLGAQARKCVEEMYAFDVEKFWRGICEDMGGEDVEQAELPGNRPIQNALSILVDFYLEGVENRENERLHAIRQLEAVRTAQPVVDPAYPGDRVLQMYQDGVMGFNYIIRFIKAYIKFKFSKENRDRKKRNKG